VLGSALFVNNKVGSSLSRISILIIAWLIVEIMSDQSQIQKIKDVLGLEDDWRAGLTQCLKVIIMVIETRQQYNLVDLPSTRNIYATIDIAKQLESFDKLIKAGFTLGELVQITKRETARFNQKLISKYLEKGSHSTFTKSILEDLLKKGSITLEQLVEINSKSSEDLSDLIK